MKGNPTIDAVIALALQHDLLLEDNGLSELSKRVANLLAQNSTLSQKDRADDHGWFFVVRKFVDMPFEEFQMSIENRKQISSVRVATVDSCQPNNQQRLDDKSIFRIEAAAIRFFESRSDMKQKEVDESVLGLIFNKASTRTRVSFQVAMTRLGGTTIDLNPNTSQIGRGELIKDTARVMSRYCDALAIRSFNQNDLKEYTNWSSIPVINALTDLEHPCQALADFLTIKEEFGNFENLILTFVGDGNNVANSLILCGVILGIEIRIACPKGYEPDKTILNKANEIDPDNKIIITDDPDKAASNANILYTDVWSSMGEELNKSKKDEQFKGFTLNRKLAEHADKNAIILHCLPAYRGKEITDEIIESKNSRVFDQAANRLHVQQALLYCLLT